MPSYFDAFPDFPHDPHAPLRQEFRRLATLKGWLGKQNVDQYRAQWARCCASEFGVHYGTKSNLAGWQALCTEVGVTDVPDDIAVCKKILKNTFVNLVDLVDARRTGTKVKIYKTSEALRAYSIRENKIFPKAEAKENGFLTALLIEMFGGRTKRRRM